MQGLDMYVVYGPDQPFAPGVVTPSWIAFPPVLHVRRPAEKPVVGRRPGVAQVAGAINLGVYHKQQALGLKPGRCAVDSRPGTSNAKRRTCVS